MSYVRRFGCDEETGETITYYINEETGEPFLHNTTTPNCVSNRDENNQLDIHKIFPRGYMSKTKKFRLLKANIIAGSNVVSHRLLLIPTVMIFPGLITVLLALLELYLHVRCHKKNKTLTDPNLYYRSPFHIVTSIFCGVCRDCDTASKIGQLQDKRRHHYDCLHRVAM